MSQRRAAIERTYAPDVRWTDAEGVTTGRDALEAKCVALQQQLGICNSCGRAGAPAAELRLSGLASRRRRTGQTVMSGFDAALIEDGAIGDLYTVLIPPQ